MTMLALTISISWHDVWTVGKYVLCVAGGLVVGLLWMASMFRMWR